MFVLDSVLLLLIVVGLHVLKFSYPNFLFFCRGAILFLPPDQDAPSKTTEPQIKIIQVQFKHVKDYPMADEYDRIVFMLASLVLYVPMRALIAALLAHFLHLEGLAAPSLFTSLICLVLLAYCLKVGLSIFWISSYNIKYSLLVCIGINCIFYVLALTVGQDKGGLASLCLELRVHLSMVFGKEISDSWVNHQTMLATLLGLNVLIGLASIPSVIKMGNWYTKTLKEVYYEEERDPAIDEDPSHKEREKLLKKKSAGTVRLLNGYLFAVLAFLCLSHPYSHQFVSGAVADAARTVLMCFMVFSNAYTLKQAIEFNGSFAYKFLSEFLNTDVVEKRMQLRQKIVPYLYLIWYHKFQFMFRVLLPLLLFILLIDLRYVHPTSAPVTPVISETHCAVHTDQLAILQNLYKCDAAIGTSIVQDMSYPLGQGTLVGGRLISTVDQTKERIGKYGLVNAGLMDECVDVVLWYSTASLFAMTVLYILFLRKTVYDI